LSSLAQLRRRLRVIA